jgi:hypothetical protein
MSTRLLEIRNDGLIMKELQVERVAYKALGHCWATSLLWSYLEILYAIRMARLNSLRPIYPNNSRMLLNFDLNMKYLSAKQFSSYMILIDCF